MPRIRSSVSWRAIRSIIKYVSKARKVTNENNSTLLIVPSSEPVAANGPTTGVGCIPGHHWTEKYTTTTSANPIMPITAP